MVHYICATTKWNRGHWAKEENREILNTSNFILGKTYYSLLKTSVNINWILFLYLQIFPLIEKYKIGHLNRIGAHLANNSQPLEMQKLQCWVKLQFFEIYFSNRSGKEGNQALKGYIGASFHIHVASLYWAL